MPLSYKVLFHHLAFTVHASVKGPLPAPFGFYCPSAQQRNFPLAVLTLPLLIYGKGLIIPWENWKAGFPTYFGIFHLAEEDAAVPRGVCEAAPS